MSRRFLIRGVWPLFFVLGLVSGAQASAQTDYERGVAAFKSLLVDTRRAEFRSEWMVVRAFFEKSLAQDSNGQTAPKCMYFLGRTYEELARRSYSNADRKAAFAAYDRMLRAFPKHGWADDSLYRKGLIWLEQLQDTDKAVAIFQAVVAKYPTSDNALEARARLTRMRVPSAPVQAAKKQVPDSAKKTSSTPRASVTLQGVRHWSSSDYTRVVMDMSQDVRYERNLVAGASGGKQLRIVLRDTAVGARVTPVLNIGDGLLSQIEVLAASRGQTEVMFNLMHMDHYRVFTLPDPYRVVIDIYGNGQNTGQTSVDTATSDYVQTVLADLKKGDAVGATHGEVRKETGYQDSLTSKKKDSAVTSPEIAVNEKQKKYAGSLIEQLGLKIRTIMIDAGHGGKDPGAIAHGLQEKHINLRMAKILGKMLREEGFQVHYVRSSDTFIPLEERTALANAKGADLFISLHCNAAKDKAVRGLEIYYLNLATDAQAVRVAARENGVSAKKISDMQFILSDLMLNSKINESRQMASLIEEEALRVMRPKYSMRSQGTRGAFFYVLTGARMPSILVEMGYLTHPAEADKLKKDSYLSTLARGLVDGVKAYKKKLERYAVQESGKS